MKSRNPSRSSRIIAVAAIAAAISFAVHATGAQAARLLPPLAHAGQMVLMQEAQVDDVRQSPVTPEDQALAKRWAELFAAVIVEFQADHRDMTANIEGDFSTRQIRVRRTTGTDAWVSKTLTRQELATGDLRALAKRLYAQSKQPADSQEGAY
jgi:hypothetical protein